MRRKKLKKKHTPIDKSELKFGMERKIRDEKYLNSYRERTCVASDNGVDLCGDCAVAAHIRIGSCAGMGQKPCDSLTVPLCDRHHREQHNTSEEWFWIEKVLKPQARRAYRNWKNGKNFNI